MAVRTYSDKCAFSAAGSKELARYINPKNEFERALSEPAQTIGSYRVLLLKSGYMTKQKEQNGKIILTLTKVKKRNKKNAAKKTTNAC